MIYGHCTIYYTCRPQQDNHQDGKNSGEALQIQNVRKSCIFSDPTNAFFHLCETTTTTFVAYDRTIDRGRIALDDDHASLGHYSMSIIWRGQVGSLGAGFSYDVLITNLCCLLRAIFSDHGCREFDVGILMQLRPLKCDLVSARVVSHLVVPRNCGGYKVFRGEIVNIISWRNILT